MEELPEATHESEKEQKTVEDEQIIQEIEKAQHCMTETGLFTLSLGLNDLRLSGHLSDVVVICHSKSANAHKAVLASTSEYFRNFFRKAPTATSLKIDFIKEEVFDTLMEFLYTARFDVQGRSDEQVKMVLQGARDLRISPLVKFCIFCFLKKKNTKLQRQPTIRRKVVSSDLTVKIKPFLPSEKVVLFFRHDDYFGKCYLQCYHFRWNYWSSVDEFSVPNNATFTTQCSSDKNLYWFGGNENTKPIGSVYVYKIHEKKWYNLADMKSPRCLATAIEVGGTVYVVGGCANNVVCELERFSISRNEWQILAPINMRESTMYPIPTTQPAVAMVNGILFVVGHKRLYSYDPVSDSWMKGKYLPLELLDKPCYAEEMDGKLYVLKKDRPSFIYAFDPIESSQYSDEPDPWEHFLLEEGFVERAIALLNIHSQERPTLCIVDESGIIYLFFPPSGWRFIEGMCEFLPSYAGLVDVPMRTAL